LLLLLRLLLPLLLVGRLGVRLLAGLLRLA
jgi:hypothetical protein